MQCQKWRAIKLLKCGDKDYLQVFDRQHVKMTQVVLSGTPIDEELTIDTLVKACAVWCIDLRQLSKLLPWWWSLFFGITCSICSSHGHILSICSCCRSWKLAPSKHRWIHFLTSSFALLRKCWFLLLFFLRLCNFHCCLSLLDRHVLVAYDILNLDLVLWLEYFGKRREFILQFLSLFCLR